MQQHGSKYFACRTPCHEDHRGWGQKAKVIFFPNMITLHIKLKGITKCNNMVANILPAEPHTLSPLTPQPWGWDQKVKIQLNQNMAMLHI